jgi:hypothetical protein
MVLQSQETVGDLLKVTFLPIKVGYPIPSPAASALCPSPQAMVRFFMDEGIQQFSTANERSTTNSRAP